MRLKKNNNNWKASGLKKKDFQNDKSFDRPTPFGKNKYTKLKKKWCKGIEGKKHKLYWRTPNDGYKTWKDAVCDRCGKVIKGFVTNWELWRKDPNDLY